LTVDEPSSIRESLQIPMVEISSAKAKVISDVISTIDGVINVSMYGDRLHVGIKEKGIVDQVLTVIRGQGVEIEGYREIVPSLEDAFIALVDREEGKRP
jgi:hypothetical protein